MKFIFKHLIIISLLPSVLGNITYPAAKKVLDAVVRVNVSRSLDNTINPDNTYMQFVRKGDKIAGEVVYGSGFIFSADGYIATNLHVLGEEGAHIQKISVTLSNMKTYDAKIVGYDRFFDLLVLKIEGTKFPTITWGDSTKVQPTNILYAFGHPLGFDNSIVSCFVSAINRNISVNDLIMSTRNFPDGITRNLIQLDGNLNPGLSGGPVTDENGLVVGISSSNFGHDEHSVGVGFCVPEKLIQGAIKEIAANKTVKSRGSLGVQAQDLDEKLMKYKNLKELSGAMISEVNSDSAAHKTGIKQGDIILSVNGHIIDNSATLRYVIKILPIDTALPIEVLRDGKIIKLSVVLQPSPEKEEIIHFSGDKAIGVAASKAESVGLYLKTLTPKLALDYGFPHTTNGVLIENFSPDITQEEPDIRAGDVIEAMDNIPVANIDDVERLLKQAIAQKKPSVLLLIHRPEGKKFEALPLP
ncbi:MAG: trypsin-like peptidase domain-containing protein [Candidatus Paracaedibacteraceae bacterium]|nr:trypsin-like peptidase domain-containing protein [Candidatus Paracaedibacteraceae bacterium]